MQVVWGKNARLTYLDELDYIFKKWNYKEVKNFVNLVTDFIKNLEFGVIQGKISFKQNLRSFVISKQTTVYFDVNNKENRIEILLFWNNKKNPQKLKDLLRNRH